MPNISVAVMQTVWDCRWSRPGYRLSGVDDAKQPETVWVCVRTGRRRPVTDDECDTCHQWERTNHQSD